MNSNSQFWPFFIYLLSVIALAMYLYGFFPINKHSPNSKPKSTENERRPRYVHKLAFIVIDALRYDFVIPEDGQMLMSFTLSSILKKESCLLTTKAQTPTVTMPRVKAITSGSLSTYIDVVMNVVTNAFEEDNFIKKCVESGLKIVFYGDDTWLKLFPKSFLRSEGTSSFFALDFTEVDYNVTRHLDKELNNTDWDVIILHYLGLDHIGHALGPKNPLIKTKLKEMDDVVKKFFNYLKLQEEKEGIKTMVIVTGDHGMKDTGSHGGVTFAEINVPLISVGNPCVSLPGWPEEYMANQVDIAPTISALLGLPTPTNSIGKIIPLLLHNMEIPEILKNLEHNRERLSKFSQKTCSEAEELKTSLENWLADDNKNEKTTEVIVKKYYQRLNQISEELVYSSTDYKIFYLISGVTLIWIFLIILLYMSLKQVPKPMGMIHWFLMCGIVLHALNLCSSSFIEEEHQTWYFFWATFCILTCLSIFNSKYPYSNKLSHFFPWLVVILTHRFLRKLNQTGEKWASLPDIKSLFLSGDGKTWLFPVYIIGMVMTFLCALNERCSKLQLTTYLITLTAVVSNKIATANFEAKYLEFYPLSRGTSEVLVFWISIGLFSIQTAYNGTPIYLVWLLLISLLLKPHNIILLPAQVFFSRQIHKVFNKSEYAIWNNIAHIWLGYVFYFYQGNSNSLANVDVASGFVGIQTYNMVYAGVMMSAHTSTAHILSFILSPKSNLIYASARLFPLAVYCTVLLFQLDHLFIWSVFSPKLLYEAFLSGIFFSLMLVNYVLSIIKHL